MEVKLTTGTKASNQVLFQKSVHVYWRFRESSGGGTVHWETSSTGAGWQEQFSYPTADLGFSIAQVKANLGVTSTGASGTTVHFDNFNVVP